MAFNFSDVAVLIKEEFGPTFIETLRRDIVFLQLMEGVKKSYNEKNIQWKINYAGNDSVGSYGELDNFGTAGEQAYTTATLPWSLSKGVIQVSGLAQRVSEGPNSIIDAVTTETEQTMKDLARNINLQMLSDGQANLNGARAELNAGDDITGIQAAIDDGSSIVTYANINRSTNPWWKSFVLANGGVNRPLTEELMFQVYNEITVRSGKITHILCSPNLFTRYGRLLVQERRQVNPGMELVGGFQTLSFNGIPVVAVPDYEENRMDFIDMDNIEYNMLKELSVEPRDPGSFDAARFFMSIYHQLVVKDPYRMGSLRDVA